MEDTATSKPRKRVVCPLCKGRNNTPGDVLDSIVYCAGRHLYVNYDEKMWHCAQCQYSGILNKTWARSARSHFHDDRVCKSEHKAQKAKYEAQDARVRCPGCSEMVENVQHCIMAHCCVLLSASDQWQCARCHLVSPIDAPLEVMAMRHFDRLGCCAQAPPALLPPAVPVSDTVDSSESADSFQTYIAPPSYHAGSICTMSRQDYITPSYEAFPKDGPCNQAALVRLGRSDGWPLFAPSPPCSMELYMVVEGSALHLPIKDFEWEMVSVAMKVLLPTYETWAGKHHDVNMRTSSAKFD